MAADLNAAKVHAAALTAWYQTELVYRVGVFMNNPSADNRDLIGRFLDEWQDAIKQGTVRVPSRPTHEPHRFN